MAKILYIEDNDDNSYMLSRRLQRKGFEVIVAKNGEDGITLACSETPALILMDMSLPGMDGCEAAFQLKQASKTRAIPIIALSAHAIADVRKKALEAGCDDYDTKPVDMSRLLAKIDSLLPKEPAG